MQSMHEFAVGDHQKRVKHSRISLMRTKSHEHLPDEPQHGSRGRQPMPLPSCFRSDVLKKKIENPSTGKQHHHRDNERVRRQSEVTIESGTWSQKRHDAEGNDDTAAFRFARGCHFTIRIETFRKVLNGDQCGQKRCCRERCT